MDETIKLTEAQERALRMAQTASFDCIYPGTWGNDSAPTITLNALVKRGLLKQKFDRTTSWYSITFEGQRVLQELDGMGGGSDVLDEKVKLLADCRKALDDAKERYADLLAQHPDLIAAEAWVKSCKQAVDESYLQITEVAEAEFAASGDKQPHPHVTIKMMTTIDYDPVKALHWAQDNARYLLILDTKQFDRTMRGVVDVPDFVTRGEQAKAFIDKDLS